MPTFLPASYWAFCFQAVFKAGGVQPLVFPQFDSPRKICKGNFGCSINLPSANSQITLKSKGNLLRQCSGKIFIQNHPCWFFTAHLINREYQRLHIPGFISTVLTESTLLFGSLFRKFWITFWKNCTPTVHSPEGTKTACIHGGSVKLACSFCR